ncbi:hypothetical protein PDE_02222 [Penicillium oxalicum 114-2]|uniref:Uncharacterized protein n=1 Tax=Penicillium oxalicum (strain 114-2 / CGMCC 5302) TaxID=933388 RepID=S7ZAN1_PENO1|nr:hypothetical protein PDE_02222 [Penicillium oxalicum 114-2]
MVRVVAILSLLYLAFAPAESARAMQHVGHHDQAVARGSRGQYSTGGPHSQKGRHAQPFQSPKISNKANLVRVGKEEDLTIALEKPYQALFGQVGVDKHNYRSDVYKTLDGFNSTVVGN